MTIDMSRLAPEVAKKLVRLINGPSTTKRHKHKLKPEVDLETEQIRKMLELTETPEQYVYIAFQAIGLRQGEVIGGCGRVVEHRLPGLRVGKCEVCSIHHEDLLKARNGFVVHGKGFTYIDYDRSVKVNPDKVVDYPVPPRLMKVALELVGEVEESNIIRNIPRTTGDALVKRLAYQAGVEHANLVHNHRLRHWFENAVIPLVPNAFELADVMR